MIDTTGELDLSSDSSVSCQQVKKSFGKINEDKDLDDSDVSHQQLQQALARQQMHQQAQFQLEQIRGGGTGVSRLQPYPL